MSHQYIELLLMNIQCLKAFLTQEVLVTSRIDYSSKNYIAYQLD